MYETFNREISYLLKFYIFSLLGLKAYKCHSSLCLARSIQENQGFEF